jgi:hypothetical protein
MPCYAPKLQQLPELLAKFSAPLHWPHEEAKEGGGGIT